jgi:hypothetical protein
MKKSTIPFSAKKFKYYFLTRQNTHLGKSRATENVPPTALPRYSMKALVIALWAIAAAIIFHALR